MHLSCTKISTGIDSNALELILTTLLRCI